MRLLVQFILVYEAPQNEFLVFLRRWRMDNDLRTEIAAFRYQLIAQVVNRCAPIKPGEISAYFLETSERSWQIPGSHKTSVSIRSLERYKHLYEKGGFEALMPAIPKKRDSLVPRDALAKAKALRLELPERSVEQIIFTLEQSGIVEKGVLSPSTLSRWFRRENLLRQKVKTPNQNDRFRRFEVETPHQLWQCDFQFTLYLPDPLSPGKKRKVKLCLILDDYSRFVVHAQFFWNEKLPVLEETLKKAIEKHGIPSQFYCDNGAAFSSKHLAHICSRLGIRLSHSKPYRPQGRGKCERIFQFVDTSFLPEAYLAIESGKIRSLEDLNSAFQIWLDGYYHQRKHGTTKETPLHRLYAFPVNPLPLSINQLRRLFFLQETRQADKAACISLNGITYEVDQELAGCKVQVRYDPFDPSDAEVYYAGEQRGYARLLSAKDNFRQNKLLKDKEQHEFNKSLAKLKSSPPATDLNFEQLSLFNAAKLKCLDSLQTLSYSRKESDQSE